MFWGGVFSEKTLGQNQTTDHGRLSIKLLDYSGREVSATLSIASADTRVIFQQNVKGGATTDVPYGSYLISLSDDFLLPAKREVNVDHPETFVTLVTRINEFNDLGLGAPTSVSIRLQPAKSCSADGYIWVKMVGVYADFSAERKVSPGGFALFEPIYYGQYLLLVLDGGRVRTTQILDPKGKVTTIDIRLPDCP
jgi:hypothetical protein